MQIFLSGNKSLPPKSGKGFYWNSDSSHCKVEKRARGVDRRTSVLFPRDAPLLSSLLSLQSPSIFHFGTASGTRIMEAERAGCVRCHRVPLGSSTSELWDLGLIPGLH